MSDNIKEIIKIRGLTKYYGKNLGIKDLDLSVLGGEVFGFLGPNGAGKTTTIRLMLGLIKASAGDIWILGRNTNKFRLELADSIGYLPGELGLYKDMTGIQYLRHFLKLRKEKDTKGSVQGKMQNLMERFKIDYSKKIAAYSKGMKQILGIINAFMHDPDVLILDEPTSGLDPIMQEAFYELIDEEKKSGKTVFLSSHIISEVQKVCDRVGFIKGGQLTDVRNITDTRLDTIKKISIVPQTDIEKALCIINGIDGTEGASVTKERIDFIYAGEMQTLLDSLCTIKINDLICQPPSLEEVFYKYY